MDSLIGAINRAREIYSLGNEKNPVYELAQQVYDKIPVIIKNPIERL